MKINFLNISLAIILLLFVVILIPFWKPFVWGIVIAVISYPIKEFIVKYVKNELFANILTLSLMIVLIIVPFFILIIVSNSQIKSIIDFVSKTLTVYSNIKLPYIGNLSQYLTNNIGTIASFLTKHAAGIFSYTYKSIMDLIFAFLTSFYLIKDKDKFLNYIEGFIQDKNTFWVLIDTAKKSLKATLLGGLVVGILQGFLVALGFLIMGISGFFVWIIIGTIVSFVPVVGTALLWLSASIYFILIGSYVKGIFLLLWGGLFVGSIDNYVRPLIIGSYMNIHPLLLFFSIMGGVALFGLIGLLVGPIVVSLSDAVLFVYKTKKLDK